MFDIIRKGISLSVASHKECARASSPCAVTPHSSGSIAADHTQQFRRTAALFFPHLIAQRGVVSPRESPNSGRAETGRPALPSSSHARMLGRPSALIAITAQRIATCVQSGARYGSCARAARELRPTLEQRSRAAHERRSSGARAFPP